GAEDHTLRAAVAFDQGQRRREERTVVLVALRIEEMDAGEIALAAGGGIEPRAAAHRQELRADAAPLQLAEQVVEADAVAADDHQIRELQLAAEQLHVDDRAGFDNLVVPRDGGEAVGAAERGDAARALSHRIRGQRRVAAFARRLDQPDEQILGASDLAVDLHRQPRAHVRALRLRAAGQAAHDRRDELVEREDRRRRKAREDDDRLAARGGKADRFARLQRHAVRDDARIVELGDDAIREIALALAGPTGQQHDVGARERLRHLLAHRRRSVRGDAETARLAARLAYGVGENLGVRVVHPARLHRFARRDDLV